MPRYTCSATVDLTYFRSRRVLGPSCDNIIASRNAGMMTTEKVATDRLRFDVEVADAGYEIFSWPGAARFDANQLKEIGDGGPIGTRPFASFLGDIFTNKGAMFTYDGEKKLNGRRLLEYRFRVPESASHYKVGTLGIYNVVAYDGRFWLDLESANLVRLEVRTAQLPRPTGRFR